MALKALEVRTYGNYHYFYNKKWECQFCALLSHFLTAYYLVTVVDSCFITRFLVISSILLRNGNGINYKFKVNSQRK